MKTAIKLKQHPTLCPLTRQNRPLFEVPINQYAARSVAENALANQLEDCVMGVA